MRVVVADGHPTMRLGLKALLLPTEMCLVGETGDGEGALRLVEELAPDLVILGLNLTGEVDGIEACCRMKALPKAPYVLVHAAYNFTEDVSSCLLPRADCFLHKSTCHKKLLDVIRRVASGERVRILGEHARESCSRLDITLKGAALTEKEQEILALMVRGYQNKEIARKLYLGLPTVKTHVRSILRKFGAKNRENLVRGGREWESSEFY